MKLIEGLKKVKDLLRKAEDLREKLSKNCADLEIETPAYGTVAEQTQVVEGWLQSHRDIVKEIESLQLRIQRTNLEMEAGVVVEDGEPPIRKTIAAWILRRRALADLERKAWGSLTNRGIKPQPYKNKPDEDGVLVANVRKYYDQRKRDKMVEIYTSEASRIDSALEVANAVIDLME